ncbi:protein of unknown function [Lactiplantibacillus plantarum]
MFSCRFLNICASQPISAHSVTPFDDFSPIKHIAFNKYYIFSSGSFPPQVLPFMYAKSEP